MLRFLSSVVQSSAKGIILNNLKAATTVPGRYHGKYGGGFLSEETPDEFDCRFLNYFNRPDLDGYELRHGITELFHEDVVPDPQIICAILRACRRVSDYSLAIRVIEAAKAKCGTQADINKIYPYIIQEIRPTLEELGLDTPEALGYDKPELALIDSDDIH